MEVAGERGATGPAGGEKEGGLDPAARGLSLSNGHPACRGTEDPSTDADREHRDQLSGSDRDADVEDTDCRLWAAEPAHRSSSRRRRRPRLVKQDTTESEDDSGRHRQRPQRWNLRLSPQREARALTEESVSRVRPLVLGPVGVRPGAGSGRPGSPVRTAGPLCPPGPRDVSCLFVTSIVFIPLGLVLLFCLLQRKEA